mgnify:CR=1 FL=1|tara:strand:+ start:2833 stop:4191 length:1359 start_codon:yes stop_codon:yes gene_type:complete
MNIYLNIENSVRELDSKLLLAVMAASRNHDVIISDQESIIKGLERKLLAPGIFHTKSLTPGKMKIIKHSKIIDIGCKITSIDEEGGLVDYGYERMIKLRYSAKTIKQASAVFAWGTEDYKALKKFFPKYSNKIHKTGSPRVDLWRPNFFTYWKRNFKKINKPFLLIPSNFAAGLSMMSFYERIEMRRKRGYFERQPEYLQTLIQWESEQFKLISHFIEAIKYLAHKNQNFDIIVRPHPGENINTWKALLDKIPNVHVIRDDGASMWIINAFAILHNGCTTAIEASFFQKPIISYIPFEAYHSKKLANDLGKKVYSLKELKKQIDNIFFKSKIKKQKKLNYSLHNIILKKIFVDPKETAAKKMINIWESISNDNLSKSNNWFLYKCNLKIMKLNGLRGKFFKMESENNNNYKFPPFDKTKILAKIEEIIRILQIKQELNYEFLSDRTLLIKRK